jgi:CBS domain containing-hemolysin-like protein
MESDSSTTVLLSVLLLLGSVFFVAAEYAMVGARRSKIEALAKKGNRNARKVVRAIDDRSTYIAAIQIGITMIGVALGAITEPWLSGLILGAFEDLPPQVASTLAIVLVTYPMVVVGELTPKYVTMRHAERVALFVITPLMIVTPVLRPFAWLFQKTAGLIIRPFGIDMDETERQGMTREEFAVLFQTGVGEGEFDESQAQFLTKTLRFDTLDAEDVMIHRLDIRWLDVGTPKEELPRLVADIRHSRIPVCDGDIDEVVGVVYVSDIVAHWPDPEFALGRIMREPEFVPETLTLDRIVALMREVKTQILIVRDEYGGTSGLVTLEDVVEEIFGDMEDRLESERPPIEQTSDVRLTARADVRYDELLDFVKLDLADDAFNTQTLASLMVDSIGRMPKLGDSVKLPIGTLKVENMARSRITRLSVMLDPSLVRQPEAVE